MVMIYIYISAKKTSSSSTLHSKVQSRSPVLLTVQLGWNELLVITSHLAGDLLLICAIFTAIYGQVANVQGLPGKAGGLFGIAGGEMDLISTIFEPMLTVIESQ